MLVELQLLYNTSSFTNRKLIRKQMHKAVEDQLCYLIETYILFSWIRVSISFTFLKFVNTHFFWLLLIKLSFSIHLQSHFSLRSQSPSDVSLQLVECQIKFVDSFNVALFSWVGFLVSFCNFMCSQNIKYGEVYEFYCENRFKNNIKQLSFIPMKQQSPHPYNHEKSQPFIEWEILDKAYSGFLPPKPRFKHQAFFYQKAIYIYGGTTIPMSEPFDDPLDIYRLGLGQSQWEKLRLKCNSKDLQVVSGHCGVLNGNRWFMFGGTNNEFRSNNYLWRLNLQTLEMNKLQSKGETPSARDSAHLFFIEKNWLVLYGGVNINTIQIFNTFHFYNIDTKQWTKYEGAYQYQVYCRLDSAFTEVNGKFYMFGGTYRNRQNEELYLNDFYELQLFPPARNLNGKVSIKRLSSDLMPEARSGHCLIALDDRYLLLLGGQNSQTKIKDGIKFDDATVVNSAWVYCIEANFWRKIIVKNGNRFKYRSQFSIISLQPNKCITFGGINSYNNITNELTELSIHNYQFTIQPTQLPPCIKCEEKKNFVQRENYVSAEAIQDIAETLSFPFTAFGLLIDNGMNHGATFINIFYHEQLGKQRQKFIRVEDNGKLPWSDQEFINSMASFSAGPTSIPASTDKKIKTAILRESLKMEYGSNCKISSLKLGAGFLHISYSQNGELIRVCLFKKQENEQSRARDRYILLYYTYSVATKQVTKADMSATKSYIQSRYSELIEDAVSQINVRNTIYIIQPKIQDFKSNHEQQLQLKVHFFTNDIINGSIANYTAFEKAGYNISDCVDVSLKAYITCLYLKNESTLIALSVKNIDPVSIPTQSYLQKVDKLCKYKHVLELNNMIEFQFKIVQLYYLYDLKKKLNYFNNGLLIYHKNRLISRFKYPFGELIPRKIYKMQGNYNLIRMFGFLELPDHVPVNIFKTKVIHPLMTEKLFSRLKFINKMFKKELHKMIIDSNLKRIAPTKLSAEQKEQDIKENPDFKAQTEAAVKQRQKKVVNKEQEEAHFRKLIDQKIMSQIENQGLKNSTLSAKEHSNVLIEEQPVVKHHLIIGPDNILQQQKGDMRQIQIQNNQKQMLQEQASEYSSSEARGQERLVELVEQEDVEIRHYGIGQDQGNVEQKQQQVDGEVYIRPNNIIQEQAEEAEQESGSNGIRKIGDEQKPQLNHENPKIGQEMPNHQQEVQPKKSS